MSMYNLWPHPSVFLVSSVTHVVCGHLLCHVPSVLPQVYFVICVSSRVTKFENFDTEILAFLWYVLFENHASLEGNNNFFNSQIFRRVVKFEKCGI